MAKRSQKPDSRVQILLRGLRESSEAPLGNYSQQPPLDELLKALPNSELKKLKKEEKLASRIPVYEAPPKISETYDGPLPEFEERLSNTKKAAVDFVQKRLRAVKGTGVAMDGVERVRPLEDILMDLEEDLGRVEGQGVKVRTAYGELSPLSVKNAVLEELVDRHPGMMHLSLEKAKKVAPRLMDAHLYSYHKNHPQSWRSFQPLTDKDSVAFSVLRNKLTYLRNQPETKEYDFHVLEEKLRRVVEGKPVHGNLTEMAIATEEGISPELVSMTKSGQGSGDITGTKDASKLIGTTGDEQLVWKESGDRMKGLPPESALPGPIAWARNVEMAKQMDLDAFEREANQAGWSAREKAKREIALLERVNLDDRRGIDRSRMMQLVMKDDPSYNPQEVELALSVAERKQLERLLAPKIASKKGNYEQSMIKRLLGSGDLDRPSTDEDPAWLKLVRGNQKPTPAKGIDYREVSHLDEGRFFRKLFNVTKNADAGTLADEMREANAIPRTIRELLVDGPRMLAQDVTVPDEVKASILRHARKEALELAGSRGALTKVMKLLKVL